jgi:hypothetical protein
VHLLPPLSVSRSPPAPKQEQLLSAPKPAPVVYVPMQGSYSAVPAANVSYAQPVVAVPVAGMP